MKGEWKWLVSFLGEESEALICHSPVFHSLLWQPVVVRLLEVLGVSQLGHWVIHKTQFLYIFQLDMLLLVLTPPSCL